MNHLSTVLNFIESCNSFSCSIQPKVQPISSPLLPSSAITLFSIGGTMAIVLPIVIIALVILSAFFAASETAFMSASKTRLKTIENNGSKQAGKVLKILEKPDRVLSTTLIGNNIVTITAASIATLWFGYMIANNEALSTLISTIVMTFMALFFTDVVPKSIAKEHPERSAMFFYPFIKIAQLILLPLTAFFGLWRKIYKGKPSDTISSDELLTIVEEAESEGELDTHESQLIRSAIEFDDLDVYDIMVPRMKVVGIPITATNDEISAIFEESQFSRLPVYEGTPDFIKGMLHEKDFHTKILRRGKTLEESLTKNVLLTTSMKISAALRLMQKEKVQMATVVDEFGGTDGIVTMEDILEELVGEIYDEHDEGEELMIKEKSDGLFVVAGDESLADMFEEIDFNATEEFESASVGGWVAELLGRIAVVGDCIEYKNLTIKVTKASEKKVEEVSVEIGEIDDEDETSIKGEKPLDKNCEKIATTDDNH